MNQHSSSWRWPPSPPWLSALPPTSTPSCQVGNIFSRDEDEGRIYLWKGKNPHHPPFIVHNPPSTHPFHLATHFSLQNHQQIMFVSNIKASLLCVKFFKQLGRVQSVTEDSLLLDFAFDTASFSIVYVSRMHLYKYTRILYIYMMHVFMIYDSKSRMKYGK